MNINDTTFTWGPNENNRAGIKHASYLDNEYTHLDITFGKGGMHIEVTQGEATHKISTFVNKEYLIPMLVRLWGDSFKEDAEMREERQRALRSTELHFLNHHAEDAQDGTPFDCAVLDKIEELKEEWGLGKHG